MPKQELDNLLKAMPRIADVVNKFKSDDVQKMAFDFLMDSMGVEASSENPQSGRSTKRKMDASTRKVKKNNINDTPETDLPKKPRKKMGTLTLVKNLNLRPPKETSLIDFIEEKQPKTNQQLHIVIVYYLQHNLGISNISVDHVYTCLKHLNKRIPKDLVNALQVTASKTAGLDTSSSEDIKVIVSGENIVEHDLPPKKKK